MSGKGYGSEPCLERCMILNCVFEYLYEFYKSPVRQYKTVCCMSFESDWQTVNKLGVIEVYVRTLHNESSGGFKMILRSGNKSTNKSQWRTIWTASSEFGIYSLCEQRRFRRACASAQSRQNLRCSLIQAVSQEEPSDRKPDPWPLWMAGHAQLKFVMTECSKTQIRLTRLIWSFAVFGSSRAREATMIEVSMFLHNHD